MDQVGEPGAFRWQRVARSMPRPAPSPPRRTGSRLERSLELRRRAAQGRAAGGRGRVERLPADAKLLEREVSALKGKLPAVPAVALLGETVDRWRMSRQHPID
ncbi:MAG: hypothetical protein R2939_16015 [Kofleriaceae bacterium]